MGVAASLLRGRLDRDRTRARPDPLAKVLHALYNRD